MIVRGYNLDSVNTFIERLSLVNYKSIAQCDVALRPLTVVVGRNGSGKSNFVDSLHFVADALTTTLEFAIRKRGGIASLKRRDGGMHLRIELTFRLAEGRRGIYALGLRALVVEEALTITDDDGTRIFARFERTDTQLAGSIKGEPIVAPPAVLHDRLALVALSGLEEFREAFDVLAAMRFYRLNPEAMRAVQDPDEGDVLREDGANIASVWSRLQNDPQAHQRLTRYLEVIVPDIKGVLHLTLGQKETLVFQQAVSAVRMRTFPASSMSDGTLRALGALVASRQANSSRFTATSVTIEEPETALHPGAVAAIMDALHEASLETQILLTSHSPDVLDQVNVETDALLVTDSRDGVTVVAEVDAASREAIRRHLYTPGELLRMDQLQPAGSVEPSLK